MTADPVTKSRLLFFLIHSSSSLLYSIDLKQFAATFNNMWWMDGWMDLMIQCSIE
jgi:hypothetical protein